MSDTCPRCGGPGIDPSVAHDTTPSMTTPSGSCTLCGGHGRLSDKDLLAAFQRTDGESTEAENLLAEIERRGLDI